MTLSLGFRSILLSVALASCVGCIPYSNTQAVDAEKTTLFYGEARTLPDEKEESPSVQATGFEDIAFSLGVKALSAILRPVAEAQEASIVGVAQPDMSSQMCCGRLDKAGVFVLIRTFDGSEGDFSKLPDWNTTKVAVREGIKRCLSRYGLYLTKSQLDEILTNATLKQADSTRLQVCAVGIIRPGVVRRNQLIDANHAGFESSAYFQFHMVGYAYPALKAAAPIKAPFVSWPKYKQILSVQLVGPGATRPESGPRYDTSKVAFELSWRPAEKLKPGTIPWIVVPPSKSLGRPVFQVPDSPTAVTLSVAIAETSDLRKLLGDAVDQIGNVKYDDVFGDDDDSKDKKADP